MTDSTREELASLYAFGLLEGAERVAFEQQMAADPGLQRLVRELQEAAAQLAHTAGEAQPSPALKTRLLATLAQRDSAAPAGQVARFPKPKRAIFVPWAIAAAFAVCAGWFAQRYAVTQQERERIAQAYALADVALRAARTELESERLLGAKVSARLEEMRGAAEARLVAEQGARGAAERQLADAQAVQERLARQVEDSGKALEGARAEILALNDRLSREGSLARLKISTLASMLNNSPPALAVAVWDPEQQSGVFTIDNMPAAPGGHHYELWIIDDKPISAGVFSVHADGRTHVHFKPSQPIRQATKFAVSREKDDGVQARATPGEVIMISQ